MQRRPETKLPFLEEPGDLLLLVGIGLPILIFGGILFVTMSRRRRKLRRALALALAIVLGFLLLVIAGHRGGPRSLSNLFGVGVVAMFGLMVAPMLLFPDRSSKRFRRRRVKVRKVRRVGKEAEP